MNGVIFIAEVSSGQGKHIKEALISAKSIKFFHPDVPITIFTNANGMPVPSGVDVQKIIPDPQPRGYKLNRIKTLQKTPYENTLYLDNDTLVIQPVIKDMFQLLDKYDIALSHSGGQSKRDHVIPACFPEFNCGVMLYKKTACTLFSDWQSVYTPQMTGHDQNSFRKAAWASKLNIGSLPLAYNWKHPSMPTPKSHRVKPAKGDKKYSDKVYLEWWKRMPEIQILHGRLWQKQYFSKLSEDYTNYFK